MAVKKKKTSSARVRKTINKKRPNPRMRRDFDGDGLSDYQEKLYGTNPRKADSDNDGLTDFEEIKIFETNPNSSDTDKDGLGDGAEVKLGLNPRGRGLLKDLFIPHEGNDFSPKFFHPHRLIGYSLTAIIAKVIVVAAVATLPLTAWLTPDLAAAQAKKIIVLTNQIRQNLRLTQLIESPALNQAAYDKAQDMLVNQYFAHFSPRGQGLNYWLDRLNYQYQTAGENLALGFSDVSEVINSWSKSQTHYANLIDPDFKEIGVGVASGDFKGGDTTLIAQFFAAPGPKNLSAETEKKSLTIQAAGVASSSAPITNSQNEKNLAAPILIAPTSGLLTKEREILVKAFSPLAEKVTIYLNNQEIFDLTSIGDSYFTGALNNLADGDYQLRLKASREKAESWSGTAALTVDQTPPIVDFGQTRIFAGESIEQKQKIIQAVAVLSLDTKEAKISFGNYVINLEPNKEKPGEWQGRIIIFNQANEEIFSPAVLPVLTAVDQAGNKLISDLNWDNITPVKLSLTQQYFYARGKHSPYTNWLFGLSDGFYKVLLAVVTLTLTLSLFIKVRKQKPKVIASGLGLIGLLIILIMF